MRGNSIWIHRHVHKTGGTSIRRVFEMLTHSLVASMQHGWKCTSSNLNISLHERVRVFEMHEGCTNFNSDVLPVLNTLRVSTRVVLTTFIREPFAHSISAWLWAGKPSFARFNRSIDYWLPWNMQSNQLLHGDFDRYFMGNKSPKGEIYRKFDDKMLNYLLQLLNTHYDIVCPTDEMVTCTRYLLKWLDLPAVSIPHIAPTHGTSWGTPVNFTYARARECKHVDCTKLVRDRTQYDRHIYDYARLRTTLLFKYRMYWRTGGSWKRM